ncbi:MAG: hypothetical protein KIT36_07520 [Alphaproteobacteria bacterium]|nr:hypothetical protein [Alphaproteobacteria bacterium]
MIGRPIALTVVLAVSAAVVAYPEMAAISVGVGIAVFVALVVMLASREGRGATGFTASRPLADPTTPLAAAGHRSDFDLPLRRKDR